MIFVATIGLIIAVGFLYWLWQPRSCPACKEGKLHSVFFDMEWDSMVYQCDKCKERFF
jgi:hypothetical protein